MLVDVKYSSPEVQRQRQVDMNQQWVESWCENGGALCLLWMTVCVTSFILSKWDNIWVVVVDEFREGTGHAHPHTDFIVPPLPRIYVFSQTHQTPWKKFNTEMSQSSGTERNFCFYAKHKTPPCWTSPTHEVSKDVHAVQIGVFAASVHKATRDGFSHLVRVRIDREDIICREEMNRCTQQTFTYGLQSRYDHLQSYLVRCWHRASCHSKRSPLWLSSHSYDPSLWCRSPRTCSGPHPHRKGVLFPPWSKGHHGPPNISTYCERQKRKPQVAPLARV